MHPANTLERFITNNPTMLQSPLARLVPQSVSAISREGNPVLFQWGDQSGIDTRLRTLHSDVSGVTPQRVLHHPGLNDTLVYPKNPDRTVNYFRGPIRKWDTQSTKTLNGQVRSRNIQLWEDVVVTEYWEGGGGRASMPVDFLQSLYLFFTEETPMGEYVGWLPRDTSYGRHLIVPLTLTVGGQDFDLNAVRRTPVDGAPGDMLVDQAVAFSFGLVRPQVFVPSVLVSRGK